jgi:hypothetical protein
VLPVNPECFDFFALIDAWRDSRRWGEAHPDLSQYFNLRYRAFAAAFGVDLDACPEVAPQAPEWMKARMAPAQLQRDEDWHRTIHAFTQSAERDSRYLSGPFAGYLEMPPEMAAVYDHFAASIAAPLTAAGAAISSMLAVLFVVLYPEAANRVISADDLVAHGFDPRAAAPDPGDYL